MAMAFIYRLVRIGTNHCYVGRTKNHPERRWTVHRADLNKGIHPSPHLQNAWNKYGSTAFEFELLEECDNARMVEREQWYMDNLNSCYNYSRDASTPSFTPEIVAKIVEANLREYANASPEEHARRAQKPGNFGDTMSRIMTGKPQKNPNSPARVAARAKGLAANPANKPGWVPTHRIGARDTTETVEKRRASRLATEAARRAQGIVYVWINDGTRAQKIVAGTPIPDGWMLGRQPAYVEKARLRKGETRDATARENMRKAQLASNEARIATGTPHHNVGVQQNYCWVTDGIENKRQLKTQPIPVGWRRGRVISTR